MRDPASKVSLQAPGRSLSVRPTYDQRRHTLPRRIAQNQTVHQTQDCLPKSSLESCFLPKGKSLESTYLVTRIQSSPHNVWRAFW